MSIEFPNVYNHENVYFMDKTNYELYRDIVKHFKEMVANKSSQLKYLKTDKGKLASKKAVEKYRKKKKEEKLKQLDSPQVTIDDIAQ